jgi:hypothetical protein
LDHVYNLGTGPDESGLDGVQLVVPDLVVPVATKEVNGELVGVHFDDLVDLGLRLLTFLGVVVDGDVDFVPQVDYIREKLLLQVLH